MPNAFLVSCPCLETTRFHCTIPCPTIPVFPKPASGWQWMRWYPSGWGWLPSWYCLLEYSAESSTMLSLVPWPLLTDLSVHMSTSNELKCSKVHSKWLPVVFRTIFTDWIHVMIPATPYPLFLLTSSACKHAWRR